MPCNCSINVEEYISNNDPLEAIISKVALLLENIDEYCCSGETLLYSPILNPEDTTDEVFSNGFGSDDCGCPILFVKDANGYLYYSVDNGVSYKATEQHNLCVVDVEITSEINSQDNTGNNEITQAIEVGCKMIIARGSDNTTYKWQSTSDIDPDFGIGDGVDDGIWCHICDIPVQIDRFYYTGSLQIATAPENANSALVKIWGGGSCVGNGATSSNTNGSGAYVEGAIQVTPLDEFAIVVGDRGRKNQTTTYGFGGNPSNLGLGACRGGGLSGIFLGNTEVLSSDSARAIMIAGGAGGGGAESPFQGGGSGNSASAGSIASFQGATGLATNGRSSGGGGGGYLGGNNGLNITSNASSSRGGTSYTDGASPYIPKNVVSLNNLDGQPQSLSPDDEYNDGNWGAGGYYISTNSLGSLGHVVIIWYK